MRRSRTGWGAPTSAQAPVAPAPLPAPLTTTAPPPLAETPVVPAAVPVPPPGAPEVPVPAPSAPACDPSPWVGAIAEDVGGFRLRLTRTCVPAGIVRFQFRNLDLADHNLWAEGLEPAAAERQVVAATPGETVVTASAPLTEGKWRLYCSFAGHEAMSRVLDVTPAS